MTQKQTAPKGAAELVYVLLAAHKYEIALHAAFYRHSAVRAGSYYLGAAVKSLRLITLGTVGLVFAVAHRRTGGKTARMCQQISFCLLAGLTLRIASAQRIYNSR